MCSPYTDTPLHTRALCPLFRFPAGAGIEDGEDPELTPGFDTTKSTIQTLYAAAIGGEMEYDNFDHLTGPRPIMVGTVSCVCVH